MRTWETPSPMGWRRGEPSSGAPTEDRDGRASGSGPEARIGEGGFRGRRRAGRRVRRRPVPGARAPHRAGRAGRGRRAKERRAERWGRGTSCADSLYRLHRVAVPPAGARGSRTRIALRSVAASPLRRVRIDSESESNLSTPSGRVQVPSGAVGRLPGGSAVRMRRFADNRSKYRCKSFNKSRHVCSFRIRAVSPAGAPRPDGVCSDVLRLPHGRKRPETCAASAKSLKSRLFPSARAVFAVPRHPPASPAATSVRQRHPITTEEFVHVRSSGHRR